MDFLFYPLKEFLKLLAANVRHQKKEFISPIADQRIRITDAAADYQHYRFENCITGIMAAGIVIELEIIQIDHGDATLLDRSLDLVLVITAVISSRQRIDIELVVIAGKTVQKFLPAFRIDQKLSIHTAHQLHHTGLSIYFHKTGCHLKQFISFYTPAWSAVSGPDRPFWKYRFSQGSFFFQYS